MSDAQRVMTPTSVGRFVAGVRAVASSSDGLVICSDCRRHMSDMAETCPHCSAAVRPIGDASNTSDPMRITSREIRMISYMVVSLALASYVVLRIAGL